ncbi:MAG: TIGR02646 family protein [Chitinophagia bacterium]|nr:TIGR02646 family protein [Chitinophagia bacterium]
MLLAQHDKQPLNHKIRIPLLEASAQHCAYCDGFPLMEADKTIDHFQPKSVYPALAFEWTNLFPACNSCQDEKFEEWSELLLKPDEITYNFENYFEISTDYSLCPNSAANEYDQRRATYTIETFKLNQTAHRTNRKKSEKEYRNDMKNGAVNTDDYSHRYLFSLL